jgi:protein-S-isoprenylcysteine O-methyltransferase Ste14
MSRLQLLHLLGWIWAIFGAYWVSAGWGKKAEQTSESPVYRLVRLAILAITFTLLFGSWTAIGLLGRHFLPATPSFEYLGFALAVLGMALAMWARIHLGQFWSDKVVLKVDHQLIRTGPYASLRHPIYSGVLLGVAGTAVLLGEWRGVLAFIILLTNYWVKAKREDQILAGAFPSTFSDHKNQAGFLLPRLRR